MKKNRRQTKKPQGAATKAPAREVAYQAAEKREEPEPGPVFFFRPTEKAGYLCQWYPCQFTLSKNEISSIVGRPIDGGESPDSTVTFSCTEKFMMYCKAARFDDRHIQARVLQTDEPRKQKSLGRKVVGFQERDWDQIKVAVVVAGNVAKFGQNAELKLTLLSTGDRPLVEASPFDRVWGIGFSAREAMANKGSWGQNLLGKALMDAREQLRLGDKEE